MEVSFLGHVLSAKGISPNPEKVDEVWDWPVPKTSKEVHSFIGLASYYHRFIPNFAKWLKPLNTLIVPPAHQAKVCRGEMKNQNSPNLYGQRSVKKDSMPLNMH